MPNKKELFEICPNCNGTGIQRYSTYDLETRKTIWVDGVCSKCNGEKMVSFGQMTQALTKEIDDIFDLVTAIKAKVDKL